MAANEISRWIIHYVYLATAALNRVRTCRNNACGCTVYSAVHVQPSVTGTNALCLTPPYFNTVLRDMYMSLQGMDITFMGRFNTDGHTGTVYTFRRLSTPGDGTQGVWKLVGDAPLQSQW